MILGTKGVVPGMGFVCCDCGDVTTAEDLFAGAYVYIVRKNPDAPMQSTWRCECCQEKWLDRQQDGDAL